MPVRHYPRVSRSFKALVLAYALSTFSEGVILPIYAVFVQEIGGGILEASGAIAIFLILSGVLTILVHRNRWSQQYRMHLLIYGWLLWVGGTFTFLLISNTATLFVAQVLLALGNAAANPPFDAALAESITGRARSFHWGLFEGLQDVFSGVAAIAGGLITSFLGFQALILVMVVFATGSFVGILRYSYMQQPE